MTIEIISIYFTIIVYGLKLEINLRDTVLERILGERNSGEDCFRPGSTVRSRSGHTISPLGTGLEVFRTQTQSRYSDRLTY